MSGFDVPIQFIGSCFLATFAPQMCARVYTCMFIYARARMHIIYVFISIYCIFFISLI